MQTIKHDSALREPRDLVVLAVTLFAAIEVPLRIAFHDPLSPFVLFSEALMSLVFLGDVVVEFLLEQRVGHRWLRTPREIAARYIRRWFLPDLIAALPIYSLVALWAGSGAPGIAFLLLNRLIKIPHALRTTARWRFAHFVNPGVYRLLLFLFWLLIFSHWTACGWIVIGGAETTGLPLDAYVSSLYWTLTTLTTVGYGDITPVGTGQRLYTIVVMLAGVGSWGYVVGNIASLFSNLDLVRARYMKTLEEMNAFLRYRAVPEGLQSRVNDYFRHLWDHRLTLDESRLLDQLPQDLAVEVALLMHRDLIRKVPLFRDAGPDFIKDIVRRLRPIVATPGAYFIHKGDIGDCMYFISEGTVEVVSEDGREVYATLSEGEFVGEMALVEDIPRTATVRAQGYCDLYVLSREAFNDCLRDHPEFKKNVREVTAERLRNMRSRS